MVLTHSQGKKMDKCLLLHNLKKKIKTFYLGEAFKVIEKCYGKTKVFTWVTSKFIFIH